MNGARDRHSYDAAFEGKYEDEDAELEMEELPLEEADLDEPDEPLPLFQLGAASQAPPSDGFAGHISTQVRNAAVETSPAAAAVAIQPYVPEQRPGSRFLRLWAKGFDAVISLGLFAGLSVWWVNHIPSGEMLLAVFVLLVFGIFAAWFSWFLYMTIMVGFTGTTIGKFIFGLKVVDEYGDKPGFGRAFARSWMETFCVVLLGVGYLFAFFDEKKRALHDHLSGTRVVRR